MEFTVIAAGLNVKCLRTKVLKNTGVEITQNKFPLHSYFVVLPRIPNIQIFEDSLI